MEHAEPSQVGSVEFLVEVHLEELRFIVISNKFNTRFVCLIEGGIYVFALVKQLLVNDESGSLKVLVALAGSQEEHKT